MEILQNTQFYQANRKFINQSLVFALSAVWILIVILNFELIKSSIIKPIHLSQNSTEKDIKYGDINIINENTKIVESNNTYLTNNFQGSISKEIIEIKNGLVYLNTTNKKIKFNNNLVDISSSQSIFDSQTNRLIVISGKIRYEDKQYESNDIINTNFTEEKVDRNIYTNNENYKNLIALIRSNNLSPSELNDLDAPQILGLKPENNTSTEEENITITGKVNEESSFYINNNQISLNSLNFSHEIKLQIGDNDFNLTSIDKYGNKAEQKLIITRKEKIIKKQEQPQKPINTQTTNTTCNCSSFIQEFVDAINNYRLENGKNSLSIDPKLSDSACKHSQWMSTNNNLNHIGENNSKFYERCQLSNTTCDAENLAYGATSGQKVFELWKNSPGHNANMLGDHNYVGVSLAGLYSTAVFR